MIIRLINNPAEEHNICDTNRISDCAYQKKNSPFRQNFNICKVSDDAKLIENNSSKKETKYLRTTENSHYHSGTPMMRYQPTILKKRIPRWEEIQKWENNWNVNDTLTGLALAILNTGTMMTVTAKNVKVSNPKSLMTSMAPATSAAAYVWNPSPRACSLLLEKDKPLQPDIEGANNLLPLKLFMKAKEQW